MNPRNAFELADMVADAAQVGKASKQAAREVGQDDDEAYRGGPRNKMARIAARATSLGEIRRFEGTSGRTNVLRSCGLSSESVASGFRSRANFRQLAGREHFAPPDEAVLARLAYFSAGPAFQMYFPQQEKACILLGYSSE